MGIAIFFVFLSMIVIVVTAVMVKKNNRLYNFKAKDANKRSAKEQKRDIKSI